MTYRASAGWTERWEHIDVAIADGIATMTLNRPDKLNALTMDAYADLRDVLTEIEHRDDVAVVVITGAGKGFCSGGDVDDIIGALLDRGDHRTVLEFTRMTGAVVQRLRELPMPVISAINGTAAGAGAVIALASDFRLIKRSASFRFLFTKVGLAGADMGCAYLLPRLVGLGRATEILMLGEKVTAEEAELMGLVTRVVNDGELEAETAALARRLATGPTFAYAATKSLLTKEQDMSLSASLELEAWVQALLTKASDHREWYDAFSNQRDPHWTGR